MFASFSLGTCLLNTQADASNRILKKSASTKKVEVQAKVEIKTG